MLPMPLPRPVARGVPRAALLLLALLALPGTADAQFRKLWGRRHPPPAPAAPATAEPGPGPGPGAGAPSAAPPTPLPVAAASGATSERAVIDTRPAPTGEVGVPNPAAVQEADRQRLLREARAREILREPTVSSAEDRLMAWALLLAIDPTDPEAARGHAQARQDLELARGREEAKQARATDAEARQAVRLRLREADAAYRSGDLVHAGSIVDEVLLRHPDDPQARSLRATLTATERARTLRRLLLVGGGVLGLTGAGMGAVAWRAIRRRRASRGAEAEPSRAMVKVVDGVGRGRIVPLQAELFRIGAADGERPDEKNDLILSDEARVISRYHCTIIRRGRRYFLIDSSLNGTSLNERALARGDHHSLRDGDEFVLAGTSRIKFLVA